MDIGEYQESVVHQELWAESTNSRGRQQRWPPDDKTEQQQPLKLRQHLLNWLRKQLHHSDDGVPVCSSPLNLSGQHFLLAQLCTCKICLQQHLQQLQLLERPYLRLKENLQEPLIQWQLHWMLRQLQLVVGDDDGPQRWQLIRTDTFWMQAMWMKRCCLSVEVKNR